MWSCRRLRTGRRERLTPREAVVESLKRLRMRGFELPDKMAYLSLTSKNERPLCDAVAWQLHGILAPETGVAREWRRFDIAVLAHGAPVALIEAKAGYAAEMIDARRPNTYLLRKVRGDIDKLRNKAPAASECAKFVLVFLTYNHRCPVAPCGVLRNYGSGRQRLVKGAERTLRLSDLECAEHYGEDEIHEGFSCYVAEWGDLPVAARGKVAAGEAFGTRVSVYYWLLEIAD